MLLYCYIAEPDGRGGLLEKGIAEEQKERRAIGKVICEGLG